VEHAVGERVDALNRRSAHEALRLGYAGSSVAVLYQGAALLLIVAALGGTYAAGFSRLASLGAIVLILLRSLSYAQALQGSIQGLYQSAPYVQALHEEEGRYLASAMTHGGRPIERIGALTFDHVSFHYGDGHPVLKDLTFDVHPGEVIGIVGPSGSGKSTLVQLLLRLREPTEGTFVVDGTDARQFALDEWYRHVSFVPQEPRLFAGTVAENIRFFRDGVDQDAIERAARLANLHNDVVTWPDGYDTLVGERGGQISGGQRQRLCIARALVERPSMIVLDEPTSALDVHSEALIRETVGALGGTTTVFVIAHRLSTLAVCNRIMAVLDGVLEGFDEPARLEATNPFYRETLKLSGLR
jgi:ABC-type multidrug transport system fused ATPase/permease subunit